MSIDIQKVKNFVGQIDSFYDLVHSDKITILGYYLEKYENTPCLTTKNLTEYYDMLALPQPKNFSDLLKKLFDNNRLVKTNDCYRVSGPEIQHIEKTYLDSIPLKSIKESLKELFNKLAEEEQKSFVKEILGCLQVESYRGAIVLTWILAMDHLQKFVIKNSLAKFNEIIQSVPQYKKTTIRIQSDFEDVKDKDFLSTIRTCGMITKSQLQILENRLEDRNRYAHPSNLVITDTISISFIEDLVSNIVLNPLALTPVDD